MSAAASRSRTDMDVIPSNHSDIPICSCFVLFVKHPGLPVVSQFEIPGTCYGAKNVVFLAGPAFGAGPSV